MVAVPYTESGHPASRVGKAASGIVVYYAEFPTMKAIVFDRFGDPADVLQVREVPAPEPGRGQVRVRMIASPINPSDLMTVRGQYGKRPALPYTPGYEGVGVIDAAGPGLLKRIR